MRAIVVTSLAVTVLGCQGAPTPLAQRAASSTPDQVADARKALARRDWLTAAPLFRGAILADPENISLHYALAVCASQLDLRDEAVAEFQWVLARAATASDEARVARAWLAQAGMLPMAHAPQSDERQDEKLGDSGLSGVARWSQAGGTPGPARSQQLHLIGVKGSPTAGLSYTLRADDDGRYEFKRIVPGTYKLTDAIAKPPKWRLKVDLEPGKVTRLDLGPDNSAPSRDDFPS